MSEAASLPEEWGTATLEDLAGSITSGATPEAGNPRYYTPDGGYAFAKIEDLTRALTHEIEHCGLQITDAAVRETAAKIYPAGTILLSMYGTIGLAKVCAHSLTANQALCALMPPFRCDSGYLLHHLDYVRPQWSRYSGQTTQANINGAIVRAHEVPLPPIGDQVAIRQVLDTLDTTIRQTEAIIEKLNQVKQGLLHDLLTRGIDANGELRPPQSQAPHLYKDSPLGWIPREWEVLGLADMAPFDRSVLRTGPFGSSLKGEHLTESGRPVVTIGSLGVGRFLSHELLYVSEATARVLVEFELHPGDIAFSRVADVGRSVVVGEAERGWIMSSNFMRISVDSKRVAPEFLQAALSIDVRVKKQIRSTVNSAGRDVASSAILMSLCFPIPPNSEQAQINVRMTAVDQRIEAEGQLLLKFQAARAGLMDDLLTGRVRVTSLLARPTD